MRLPDKESTPATRERIHLEPDIAAAILKTLLVGWQHACVRDDVHPGADEVPMTERLRDCMRGVLNQGLLPWGKAMIIASGTESRSRLDLARPDGVTDLPIYIVEIFLRLHEHEPHAVVECKRVAGADSGLCRRYVREGVDRFRSGKYAENHSIGFMVGYVIAGDENEAVAGINNFLSRTSRVSEELKPSDLIDEDCFRWSEHVRDASRSKIGLHHAFLLTKSTA